MTLDQLPSIPFGNLLLSFSQGLAYQPNPKPFSYGQGYWDNYQALETSPIADKLNAFRCELAERYTDSLLDMGIGSGAFLRQTKAKALGYDVNPIAIQWLKDQGKYFDPYDHVAYPFQAWTFWDCLEHIPNPGLTLSRVTQGQYVLMSLPIFDNLTKLRRSKHYKPDEHLTYFTAEGLIGFAKQYGLELVELSDEETQLGREDILTFVFQKAKA